MDCYVPQFGSALGVMEWVHERTLARSKRVVLDSIFRNLIWVILTYQNFALFRESKVQKELLFDNTLAFSFT